MTAESNRQSAKWYKHTLFLILLNTVSGILFWMGTLMLSSVWWYPLYLSEGKPHFTINGQIVSLGAGLLGLLIGGTLGYTVWAKFDSFTQARAVLLAGIWAVAFGCAFFSASFSLYGLFIFSIIAIFATYRVVGAQLHLALTLSAPLTLGTMLLSLKLLDELLSGQETKVDRPPIWLIGGIFGVFFTYFIQRANNAEQRRQQAQQRRDMLAQGLLLADNYVVGDDGELIEAEGGENHIKGSL